MTSLESYFAQTGLRNIVVSDVMDPETGEPFPYFGLCESCLLGGNCTDCDIWGTNPDGNFVEYDTVPLCQSCRYEAEYGPDAE